MDELPAARPAIGPTVLMGATAFDKSTIASIDGSPPASHPRTVTAIAVEIGLVRTGGSGCRGQAIRHRRI